MLVTVAICTWNRAALLDRTLARLRELAVPPGLDWELLVVNNNCTDETDAVLARYDRDLPLRRLAEPKPGLSHARNCAMEHARGELLIWTDDDVLVDPSWLAAYASAAAGHPGAAYFGGPVEPWFAVEPPAWVRQNLAAMRDVYALRDYGPASRRLAAGEGIVGANFALRPALTQSTRFDPNLGRRQNALTSGEECAYCEALAAAGHYGVWVGGARVRHYIPADRLTPGYVWTWHQAFAAYRIRHLPPESFAGPTVAGHPRWVVGKYVRALVTARLASVTRGRTWFRAFTEAAGWRGVLDCLKRGTHAANGVAAGKECPA